MPVTQKCNCAARCALISWLHRLNSHDRLAIQLPSNIGVAIQEFGLRNQMLDRNRGFFDIVSRVIIDAEVPPVVEQLDPEWQVMVLRQFRRLKQSHLIAPMLRQARNLAAIDRSGCTKHPYV